MSDEATDNCSYETLFACGQVLLSAVAENDLDRVKALVKRRESMLYVLAKHQQAQVGLSHELISQIRAQDAEIKKTISRVRDESYHQVKLLRQAKAQMQQQFSDGYDT